LAFVGLVQGAGISANFPNPDGTYPDASRDFVGQGAANVASGFFRGMPVGGSVSATSLNKEAGAKSRQSLLFAAIVMAIVIVVFGNAVGYVAMPALAGLLMLVGYRSIKPGDLQSVWRTGVVQKAVLAVTFVLTLVVPLQYAVLLGVGTQQGRRRALAAVAPDRGPRDGDRGGRVRGGGRLRRHARPRRPAHAHRLPHHQAG
jgi:SulP family sulfate permease